MAALSEQLRSAQYVLALLGAGLSAPSGIPTFMDLPPLWHGFPYTWFSSLEGFKTDPVVVWQFYESLRQRAVRAQPNEAHRALAKLAQGKQHFLAITQNIDDLAAIHGSIFKVKCSGPDCAWTGTNIGEEPLVPCLDLLDLQGPLPKAEVHQLPRCPRCHDHLIRPGIVWYGELLAEGTLSYIDKWLDEVPRVDVMLVVGTSGELSAGFIDDAREKGAQIAHFNLHRNEALIEPDDWVCIGDATETLPAIIDDALKH